MPEAHQEYEVELGDRKYTLRAICVVFPQPGITLRGPLAFEAYRGPLRLHLERSGPVWIASVTWSGSWEVKREGISPQAAFDRCEWEIGRMHKEISECLGLSGIYPK